MAALLRAGRLWLAAAAAALSVITAQPAVEAWTVKGDAAAWAEVVAALKKQHSTSFRAKSAGSATTTIIEFAPPGSQHLRASGDGIGLENITVGNTSWRRGSDGKYDCTNPLTLLPEQMVPIWDRKGEVTVTRVPDLVINGTPTHGYAYTATFEQTVTKTYTTTITINTKLYVGVQSGLPLRQITETGTSAKTTSILDYYDYGAKIIITPPC